MLIKGEQSVSPGVCLYIVPKPVYTIVGCTHQQNYEYHYDKGLCKLRSNRSLSLSLCRYQTY